MWENPFIYSFRLAGLVLGGLIFIFKGILVSGVFATKCLAYILSVISIDIQSVFDCFKFCSIWLCDSINGASGILYGALEFFIFLLFFVFEVLKPVFFIYVFIIIRGILPRYRYDQLMLLG